MKRALQLLFTGILAAMLWVTTRASLDRSVLAAARDLWNDPWGLATLFDAYFGFITFLVWLCYKEVRWGPRLAWVLLVLSLGNIAMAGYLLRELARLGPGDPWERVLLRRPA